MHKALQDSCARARLSTLASGCALAFALAPLAACTGGPHPLPPWAERGSSSPQSTGNPNAPIGAAPPTQAPVAGTAAPSTPTSGAMNAAGSGALSAAGSPAVPPAAMNPPATSGGAAGAAAPTMPGAPAGSAGMTAPPPSAAAGSGGSAGMAPTTESCDGPTGALSANEAAPANLLFVMDRSLEMAGDFQGSPRWQVTAQALSHAFGSRAAQVTLGALLYPSARSAQCTGPDWVCALQQPAMCSVNEMSAADQVAFQQGNAALTTLLGDEGLYSPVTAAAGVPLAESLQRADAALAGRALAGRTSVVILASGTPSCQWNVAQASATLARWRTERGVQTHVVALPGSPAETAQALAALAEAGGTGQVHAPSAVGALEATLQSIVVDSLSSCTLQLDPPAPDPSAVRVLVTEDGVERVLPRSSATGEALWTISADGRTVTLLGSSCDAARGGTYDAVRVVLGCARP